MAIKVFCDKCGIEINNDVYHFTPLIHITKPDGSGYVNKDFEDVSGRSVDYILCLTCYNKVMRAAWNEFKNK